MMDLTGKKILLGITGGIAAYKMANVASALTKEGAEVHVLMSENATQFITPLTFETLTRRKAYVDTFDRVFSWDVKHISLTEGADLFAVAPATANFIAKAACGLADDMLTTTFLAATCPKLVAPAMNVNMYENPATQQNIETLRRRGMLIVEPDSGYLACGVTAKGRLPEPPALVEAIHRILFPPKRDLEGVRLLVTAGPTREYLDPVRFLSNRSTGKMGYAIADAAQRRGAVVTLVTGKVSLAPPEGVETVPVESAEEMYRAVMDRLDGQDMVVKAAAVADFTPAQTAEDKLKKDQLDGRIELVRTKDILAAVGECARPDQVICGFSMETRDLVENSSKKLASKRADMIVANNLKQPGAGFEVDTNVATLLTKEGAEELPLLQKGELADRLLDRLLALWQAKRGEH